MENQRHLSAADFLLNEDPSLRNETIKQEYEAAMAGLPAYPLLATAAEQGE